MTAELASLLMVTFPVTLIAAPSFEKDTVTLLFPHLA